MIGDHQQLRPKVEFYPLTKIAAHGYNLNVSLFERLAPTAGVITLCEQHRMRPEISQLCRNLMYPNLEDHETVQGRDDIKVTLFLSITML